MNEDNLTTKAAVAEINRLHKENMEAAKQTLERAIRIGELLHWQKRKAMSGGWLDWLKANVEFGERTAQRYMMVYAYREKLKSDTVTDLTSAYRFITEDLMSINRLPSATAPRADRIETTAEVPKAEEEKPAPAAKQQAQTPKAQGAPQSAPTTEEDRRREVYGLTYDWAEVNIDGFRSKFDKSEQGWVLWAIIDYCCREIEERGLRH